MSSNPSPTSTNMLNLKLHLRLDLCKWDSTGSIQFFKLSPDFQYFSIKGGDGIFHFTVREGQVTAGFEYAQADSFCKSIAEKLVVERGDLTQLVTSMSGLLGTKSIDVTVRRNIQSAEFELEYEDTCWKYKVSELVEVSIKATLAWTVNENGEITKFEVNLSSNAELTLNIVGNLDAGGDGISGHLKLNEKPLDLRPKLKGTTSKAMPVEEQSHTTQNELPLARDGTNRPRVIPPPTTTASEVATGIRFMLGIAAVTGVAVVTVLAAPFVLPALPVFAPALPAIAPAPIEAPAVAPVLVTSALLFKRHVVQPMLQAARL
ncbi:hypothetical protein C8R43DRAFT_1135905 [Mycena crocata]|nr:hypothetical protein C8R43DRAFT_1135905 [Mycena crocata]